MDNCKQEALQDVCHMMEQNRICEGVSCSNCPLKSVEKYDQIVELISYCREDMGLTVSETRKIK